MSQTLMLTGDVNLMNVADPAVPFKLVAPIFAKSDFVFSNLECCFYIPPGGHSLENEGFFAEAKAAEALKMTAEDLKSLGIVDQIVPEPAGGAGRVRRVAAAGGLDGRAATTHWIYADALQARYPDLGMRADYSSPQAGESRRQHAQPGTAAHVGHAVAGHRAHHQDAFQAEVDAPAFLGDAFAQADEQKGRAHADGAAQHG